MNDRDKIQRTVLPIPDQPRIGLTTYDAKDPETKYPPIQELRPPTGAPNVLVILIDDVGFGASSAFGGPCQTPNFEKLAADGLKFNRFHTTALCSPSRQAMLTGRNHHSAGMGAITEMATSAPGQCSLMSNTISPLARTLTLNGYSTSQFGKCHEVPVWQTSPMGPFDHWPSGGGGFEYFYGFIGGETNQWYPALYEGTHPVEPEKTPEQGYHLTEDLTNKAIMWIRQQKSLMPDKPFFTYFAPGATHAPHHVPKEWKHITQYFEMFGHRSIYHDGWRAVCPWPGPSFKEAGLPFGAPIDYDKLTELDAKGWELYHLETDYAENHNIAADNRAKLIEMVGTWYVEAGKYNVLPIDSRGQLRAMDPRPQIAEARTSYTLYPNTQRVPTNAGPNVMNRSYVITADVDVPKGGAEGVLLSNGDCEGGLSFYVQDGKLQFVYSYVGSQFFHVESNVPVPEGRHKLRYEFEATGKMDYPHGKGAPGRSKIYIDDKMVGQGDVPLTNPVMYGLAAGFVCGADTGSPVWDKYEPPFPFTGTLYSTTVDVSGDLIRDPAAEMRVHMARQ